MNDIKDALDYYASVIADGIASAERSLAQMRQTLERCQHDDPTAAYLLLGLGVERALVLYSTGRQAFNLGAIDRATWSRMVALANEALALDDTILEVVADAIPVTPRIREVAHIH